MIPFVKRRALAATLAGALILSAPAAAMAMTEAPAAVQSAITAPVPATPAPGSMQPGEQNVTISKLQALAIVRRYFTIPEGPGTLDAQLNTRGPRSTWELMYSIQYDGGGRGYGIGSVDARTGQILRFNLYAPELRPLRTGPQTKLVSEQDALYKAWALVTEMFPDEARYLRPAPPEMTGGLIYYGMATQNDAYSFTWVEYKNDVPLMGSMIRVSIDTVTGDYIGLETSFLTNVNLPAGPAKLSAEEAVARYRESVTPRLVYQMVSRPYPYAGPGTEVKLAYNMLLPGLLDATTGKFVDYAGREPVQAGEPEAVPANPDIAVAPGRLPLDQERAVAFARALLEPPAGAEMSANPEGPFGFEQAETLGVHWFGPTGSASASIDLSTGMIRYANRQPAGGSSGFDPAKPSAEPTAEQREQAKQAALAVVQSYFSQVVGEVKLQPEPQRRYYSSQPTASFYFQRYENGIPANFDGIWIDIDVSTMKWINLSAAWTPGLTFPDAGKAISPEKALEAFMQGRQAALVYQLKANPEQPPMYGPPQAPQPQDAMLVYQLASPAGTPPVGLIDALTGSGIDWNGSTVATQKELDKLLSGHWAEGELRYMLGVGALPSDRLNPGAALTRTDALQLLLTGTRDALYAYGGPPQNPGYTDVKSGSALFGIVSEGYRRSILRPEGAQAVFGGDVKITRAEFAVWLVRTLRLGGLARSALKAETSFTDLDGLTQEERNAVAFLEALGVISPGAAFRGHDSLTQAEGSALVVRLIKYVREAK